MTSALKYYITPSVVSPPPFCVYLPPCFLMFPAIFPYSLCYTTTLMLSLFELRLLLDSASLPDPFLILSPTKICPCDSPCENPLTNSRHCFSGWSPLALFVDQRPCFLTPSLCLFPCVNADQRPLNAYWLWILTILILYVCFSNKLYYIPLF